MSLLQDFEIRLEFHSDWHVGTGQGRLGSVDAEIRRDLEGLPFVPAKTLLGVWRDACETVAETFDRASDRSGAWQTWITWLFGSAPIRTNHRGVAAPTPAALRLTPGRAPQWLQDAVRGRPALAQAAVVLRPGVAIDDETGTAADRLLRVEERAIRGLQLHSLVSIAAAGPPQLAEPAELLLRAGARLVEAIGGKRHRGSGRVALLLPGAHVVTADGHPSVVDPRLNELLAGGPPAAPAAPPVTAGGSEIHPYGRRRPGIRRTLRIIFEVITPVVAAANTHSNVITSGNTIPGTALLGTILSRVETAGGTAGRRGSRIGLGDLVVGDAVPAVGDPRNPATVRPSQPVPLAWRRSDKGRGDNVHNVLTGEPEPGQRAKQMSGRIAAAGVGRWQHIDTALTVSTHAVIDDAARRPTVASGGVYTYLGIAPGTLLCSDVVLPASARLRLASNEQLRFGRSRKDDFGLVRVVDVIDLAAAPAVPEGQEGTLLVWCTSDVLLRDERLAPDPSARALARALSQALAPISCTAAEAAMYSAVRRDGFAVTWGRPRLSQVALRAGSVVTLTVTDRPDPDRLAEVERDGIGERTAEGFGRIRFNPAELATQRPAVVFAAAPPPPGTAGPAAPPPVDGPHPIEINAWRRAIRRASAALPPDDLVRGITSVAGQRAQLGALRAQLERLSLEHGQQMVRAWLEATREVRARREVWGIAVLDDLRALLLDDDQLLWHRLRLDGPQPHLVLAPGREDLVRARLHREALTAAVTDALRHLHRNLRRRVAGTDTPEARP